MALFRRKIKKAPVVAQVAVILKVCKAKSKD